MTSRDWLWPSQPTEPARVTDAAQRRRLIIELAIVFSITLGLSGVWSLLTLIDLLLRPGELSQQRVAIHSSQAQLEVIDLLKQLLTVVEIVGWALLVGYLLARDGIRATSIGLDRFRLRRDAGWGLGLALLIGVPGLIFYVLGHQLDISATVAPSTLADTWWRPISLILSACGQAIMEEMLVVGYLLTRLRQLGWRENSALLTSAVLRGSYHLYQGFGGFIGNVLMGLLFARVWQRTNRLLPLIIAHAVVDIVAFVGYALLRDRLSWLP